MVRMLKPALRALDELSFCAVLGTDARRSIRSALERLRAASGRFESFAYKDF
jgi:UDP-N-acetylmuramyl tripeptide synthase